MPAKGPNLKSFLVAIYSTATPDQKIRGTIVNHRHSVGSLLRLC
jgi:hypothetical protein